MTAGPEQGMEQPSPATSSNSNESSSSSTSSTTTPAVLLTTRPVHVVFIHLDWGIGGAEQLMLQLAAATKAGGHRLTLVTSRCEPDHCFAALKPGTGSLYPQLHVWGSWIPASVCGYGRAACSTARLLYLAYCVARKYKHSPDLTVVDVLPTPLPFLQYFTESALLFYCHFPDQLLLQQQQVTSWRRSLYRRVLDALEVYCLRFADRIVVNSKFTQKVVEQTFGGVLAHVPLPVLYPALDTASLDAYTIKKQKDSRPLLVSLNRYERKKNLELVIQTAAWLAQQKDIPQDLHVCIAGGYDVQNAENVEYLTELETLARELAVPVDFRQSISEMERNQLLRTATAVLYTPANEHFGIVPLEAMYSSTPVVACKSGGPVETIQDSVTGYLCEPTAESFGRAVARLLQHPNQATAMGRAGRLRVLEHFSPQRLNREWNELVQTTVVLGKQRARPWYAQRPIPKTVLYCLEAVLTLSVYWLVMGLLRHFFGVSLELSWSGLWAVLTAWVIRIRRSGGVVDPREL